MGGCRPPDLSHRAARPVFELAFECSRRNGPVDLSRPVLGHGAICNDNLRVGQAGLIGALDRERAQLGDPMEEMGSLCPVTCMGLPQ